MARREPLPCGVSFLSGEFDNEILAQIFYAGYRVGEISCPTKYFEEASSIDLKNSIVYGLGVIATALKYRFQKWNCVKLGLFSGLKEDRETVYYRKV